MKKINAKKLLISTLAGTCLACAGTATLLLDTTTAAASGAVEFEMMGASVRTADPDGIRFVAQISNDAWANCGENAKYGIILVPEDMDTAEDLTVSYADSYVTSNSKAIVIEGGAFWNDELCEKYGVKEGYAAFSSALIAAQEGDVVTSFPTQFYNRPLTAVGFVIPEEGETIYTEKVTRSIGYVATVERLKETYEENEVVEKIAAATDCTLSVNGGEAMTDAYKKYAPELTIGGMPATTSAAVKVTYTSSDPNVAKIVDGKVQPVATGNATITATISVDTEKTVTVTEEVAVNIDPTAPVTLNDATEKYTDVDAISAPTTKDGKDCVKVTTTGAWQITYIPFYNADGTLMTAAEIQAKYTTITFDVLIETADVGAVNGATLVYSAAVGEWTKVTISTDVLDDVNQFSSVNYDDTKGLTVTTVGAGNTYIGAVTAKYTATLATPTVEIWQDGRAVWTPVEGAVAYEYTTDGLTMQTTTDNFVQLSGKNVFKVRALGDGDSYMDSAFSETMVYTLKDILNACEDVSSVQAVASVATSTEHVFYGEKSLALTSATDGWWFNLNLGSLTLEQLQEKYESFTFNVHSTYPNMEGIGAANSFYLGNWRQLMTFLGYGDNVVTINTADITSADYNGGWLTFVVGGACTLTIDNVYAIAKVSAEATAREVLLNPCESGSGFWCNAGAMHNTDAQYIAQGNTSIAMTFAGWQPMNINWGTASITDYEKVKLTIFSTAAVKLLAGDINYINDPNCILAELSVGRNDVEIPVSKLVAYNLTAQVIAPYVTGACTLYFDNIIGVTAPTAPISFGNTFILGDSYSTFEGWLPHDYAPWYTVGEDFGVNGETDVTAVEQTWWHQLLTETGSNLVQDCAYSGTTICNAPKGWGGTDETHRSFITRFERAVNEGMLEGVDTIFLYGGTNDFWLGNDNVPKGTPKYGDWTEEDLKQTYPALCYLLNMMQWHAPNARIVVVINVNALSAEAGALEIFHTIANNYGVDYVDVTYTEADLSAGHPTVQGMTMTKDTILSALSAK